MTCIYTYPGQLRRRLRHGLGSVAIIGCSSFNWLLPLEVFLGHCAICPLTLTCCKDQQRDEDFSGPRLNIKIHPLQCKKSRAPACGSNWLRIAWGQQAVLYEKPR